MILVTVIVLSVLCGSVHLADNTLELVHVITRHCDRTPDEAELYPSSPYYDEHNFDPYGYGQLTNKGKKRCYEIGTAIRHRYDGFLNASYHYSLIEARSTNYGRCKESLELVLAGLFPPTKELIWYDTMNWLPIAFLYDEKETDKVLFAIGTEIFEREDEIFLQSEGSNTFSGPFNELMEYFSNHIEEPVDLKRMGSLAAGVQVLVELGKPLPDWIKSKYPSPIKESLRQFFAYKFGTKKLNKMLCSYFFKKIIEDTEMKINGTLEPANRKLFIYTGHDLNIFILFAVFNIFDIEDPPFGSYCLLEVHNINGTYGFKLFYYDYTTPKPYLIQIPGYGDFAPIDKLKIQNQEYLQVEGLFDQSHSTRITESLLCIIFLFFLVLNL